MSVVAERYRDADHIRHRHSHHFEHGGSLDLDRIIDSSLHERIGRHGPVGPPTKETRIIRKARLGDGSTVTVVFSAGLSAEMPYGSDRTLLYWMHGTCAIATSALPALCKSALRW